MDQQGPKDNANPLIRPIDPSSTSLLKKKAPLGWREIENLVNGGEEPPSSFRDEDVCKYVNNNSNDVDRAVLQALTDVSKVTNGEGVALFKKLGLVFPDSATGLGTAPTAVRRRIHVTTNGTNSAREEDRMDVDGDDSKECKTRDKLDADEIFDIIRNIQDPEHPLTLEQLGVVGREQIEVHDILDNPTASESSGECSTLRVRFTPTVPHCSMATLIGLSIQVKLLRSLPARFKIKVCIEPGTHQSEKSVNKQLGDKERVCAALENPHLLKVVNRCIRNGMTGNMT